MDWVTKYVPRSWNLESLRQSCSSQAMLNPSLSRPRFHPKRLALELIHLTEESSVKIESKEPSSYSKEVNTHPPSQPSPSASPVSLTCKNQSRDVCMCVLGYLVMCDSVTPWTVAH